MNRDKELSQLYQYASEYKFHEFSTLFSNLATTLPAEVLQEAYLWQAQIKLYTADATLLDDLNQAPLHNRSLRFPCLNNNWLSDSPNRFIVLRSDEHSFEHFWKCLPIAEKKLGNYYGPIGYSMVNQLQSEILYFRGMFSQSLHLAAQQKNIVHPNPTDTLMAQSIAFRCYLATGVVDAAERCMLSMIRISKDSPKCLIPYRAIRTWSNLTTSWGGDTQRFYEEPTGEIVPCFEDRLDAIQKGFSRMTPLEKPFVEYAGQQFDDIYTLREYYMDVFHAMYWAQIGDYHQTERGFLRAYRIARSSGLIMPFVESGKQLIPLLSYVKNTGMNCSHEWLDRISSLAEQYEENLTVYGIQNI